MQQSALSSSLRKRLGQGADYLRRRELAQCAHAFKLPPKAHRLAQFIVGESAQPAVPFSQHERLGIFPKAFTIAVEDGVTRAARFTGQMVLTKRDERASGQANQIEGIRHRM